jgi:uncharacterized protein (TIGR00251 family)
VYNSMSISETKNGIIIKIFVKPNSPKFCVKYDGDEIIVHSTEEPVKGKGNKEILKELSKLLHTKVDLASGFTSKEKQLIVKGMGKQQAEQLLKAKPS